MNAMWGEICDHAVLRTFIKTARRLVVVVCFSSNVSIPICLNGKNYQHNVGAQINNNDFQIHASLIHVGTMERARHTRVDGLNVNVKETM